MVHVTDQQGFTIIEVLIAMTLLAVGILAAGSMQITSLGGNNLAIRITEASTWAGDMVETIIARDYNDASLIDTDGNGVAGLDCTDSTGTPACTADVGPLTQGDFTIFWNVANNSPLNGCKTIRVIVRRSDKGVMRTVALDFTKMRPI